MEKKLATTVPFEDMPSIVANRYANLLDKSETEPTVERNGYGRMILTHQNTRVRLTISYRLNGRTWAEGELKILVDGSLFDGIEDIDRYVAIFADPDNGERDYIPKGSKKAKLPEFRPADEQHLPSVVARIFNKLRKATVGTASLSVEALIALDQSRYLIRIDIPGDGSSIYVIFRFDTTKDTWILDSFKAVSFKGYDVTEAMSGPLKTQLMSLAGANSRANQIASVPGGQRRGAAVTNSTEVRKSTVVRV